MKIDSLRVFIGFDTVETVAYHVLCQSIISNASCPVSITPLSLSNLSTCFNRGKDGGASNEFTYSRFLVPYLSGFDGMAIFMDCDMLLTGDLKGVFEYIDPKSAVSVVQHDYIPKSQKKYLGNVQEAYPRKNWSSFVVWNCSHPSNQVLTPAFVETASGATLHRFSWLKDHQIGSLPQSWNHLVGEYPSPEVLPDVIHWTLGGPYFAEFADAEYSKLWFDKLKETNSVLNPSDKMMDIMTRAGSCP